MLGVETVYLWKKFWPGQGDMCKYTFEKIIGVGQGNQNYPARK
jgi:hypothetical protein